MRHATRAPACSDTTQRPNEIQKSKGAHSGRHIPGRSAWVAGSHKRSDRTSRSRVVKAMAMRGGWGPLAKDSVVFQSRWIFRRLRGGGLRAKKGNNAKQR